MPSRAFWPILAAALLTCISHATRAEVIDTAGAAPGTYVLTIDAAGRATVTGPTRLVRLADLGGPTTPAPPTTPPVESALAKNVRQQTLAALSRGASPDTAAKLAVVYALVSDDCSAGRAGMPQLASPLIVAATDAILKDLPAAEKAAWNDWRTAIGALLGAVPGIGSDKAATAAALDQVAEGMQAAINSAAVAAPGILDKIDFTAIRELLKPLLERLLAKLIEDLLKKLPM